MKQVPGRCRRAKLDKGIVFFLDGRDYAPLLVTAMYTLRKNYSGGVHVFLGPNDTGVVECHLEQSKMPFSRVPALSDIGNGHRQQCWNTKPVVHKHSPFDVTVVYDIDHIFVRPLEEELFLWVQHYGLLSMRTEVVMPRKTRNRICSAMGSKPISMQRTNGGCVGSVRGSDLIEQWSDALEKIADYGLWLADEYALAYVMAKNGIPVRGWQYSCGARRAHHIRHQGEMAYHLINKAWRSAAMYRNALREAIEEDFLGIGSDPWYRDCGAFSPNKRVWG